MLQLIKKIERLLNVELAPYKYDEREENAYRSYQGKLTELYLNNLDIDTFADIKQIYGLTIKNATVSSLSVLLQVNVYRLTLENVVFKNTNDSIITNDTLQNITFTNIYFNAKNLRNCTDLKFAFFHDCKIENLYEISCLPKLYQLHFDNITLGKLEKPKLSSASRHRILDISNMQFNDIAMWLPFANIKYLMVHNCHIQSMSNLYCFEKLESFELDSDSIIENTEFTNHKHQSIKCEVKQGTRSIDLQQLFPIVNYVNELSFCNFKEKEIHHIEKFKSVTALVFEKSEVYLDAFIQIASQINTVSIQDSSFKSTKHLKQFTNLTTVDTNSDDLGIKSLKELIPLKDQLKKFVSWDSECEDLECINEFSRLEYLQISGVSLSVAAQILKMKSLKHLYLYVGIKEEEDKNKENPVFSLQHLTNLERLNVSFADVSYTGFEHLKKLKGLKIEYGGNEINSFPKMDSLERLNIQGEGKINISLEKFPNLKELKVEGQDINLILNHPQLEILEIPYINKVAFLVEVPNLKRLHLPKTDAFSDVFKRTPNLIYLDFLEFEKDNLDFLKPLQQLEYVNLMNGTVSNISALNALPNLKEANLYGLQHLEKQLEQPEVAVYLWINRTPFYVYEEDDLWI